MGRNPPEKLLEKLIENGVLRQESESLVLTDEFKDRRETRRESPGNSREELVASLDVSRDLKATLEELPDRTAADLLALDTFDLPFEPSELITVGKALKQFDEHTPTDGIPRDFVPIEGEHIPSFLDRYPTAVLYFWREDCEPCSVVRERLEKLLDDTLTSGDVGLGAIYGPGSAEFIRDQYDVAVAPTTLFCTDGRVDSRVIGAEPLGVYRREIEIILED